VKSSEEEFNQKVKMEMDSIALSLERVTKMIQNQKSAKLKVREEVTGSITKSMSLWNSMIVGMGERTDLNI